MRYSFCQDFFNESIIISSWSYAWSLSVSSVSAFRNRIFPSSYITVNHPASAASSAAIGLTLSES